MRNWHPGVVSCKNVLQSLQMLLVLGNDSNVPCFVLKAVFSKVTQQCLLFLPCLPFAFTFFFPVTFKHRPIAAAWNARVALRVPNIGCMDFKLNFRLFLFFWIKESSSWKKLVLSTFYSPSLISLFFFFLRCWNYCI